MCSANAVDRAATSLADLGKRTMPMGTQVAPEEGEVGVRRRTSLSVTDLELPSRANTDLPPNFGTGPRRSSKRRSTLSLNAQALSDIFHTGSLRKSRSSSLTVPPPRSASVSKGSNPYLQLPRKSLQTDSGVRRLSALDLDLLKRGSNTMRRSSTEPTALCCNPNSYTPSSSSLLRDEDGAISISLSASGSQEDLPDIGRSRSSLFGAHVPRSRSSSSFSIPKSLSTNSFVSTLTKFISEITGDDEEAVQRLDDLAHNVMANDDGKERYGKQVESGELIVWDPITGLGDMMAPGTMKRQAVRDLIAALTEWINDTLCERRIVVLDIFQDLYDGQVLEELLEVLNDTHRATTRNFAIAERLKKERLRRVLVWVDEILMRETTDPDQESWNLERIWQQDIIATLHFLVALCQHFTGRGGGGGGSGGACKLPEHVWVEVERNELDEDTMVLQRKTWREHITGVAGAAQPLSPPPMDVFDKFFIQAPHKIEAAEQVLLEFVNRHLGKMTEFSQLTSFRDDFCDGVNLVMLLAILGGYCIRLHEMRLPVNKDSDRAHNLLLALRLMRDAGIEHPGVDRPDDIMEGNTKAIMRVLYPIFKLYKYAV